MNINVQKNGSRNFRVMSTIGICAIGFTALAPFAVNHLIQGRLFTGSIVFFIMALSAATGWMCANGKYSSLFFLLTWTPIITTGMAIAFQEQGFVVTYWCYLVLLAWYFTLSERHAWFANIFFLIIIYYQQWYVLEFHILSRFVITTLGVSAFSIVAVKVISNQQKILEELAVTDTLTGLLNRTLLTDSLDTSIQQSRRADIPTTLIALDIDHFKRINDEFGHNVGDDVLRHVGEFLNRRMRHTDMVFRIGGEEFLILLFNTNNDHGRQLAKELCKEFASLTLLPGSQVTVSIGVATLQSIEDKDDWMKRADEKLYQAKQEGRNRVVS